MTPWTTKLVWAIDKPMYKLGLQHPWKVFLKFWYTKFWRNIPFYRCEWCTGDFDKDGFAGHAVELCHCKCVGCDVYWEVANREMARTMEYQDEPNER